MKSVGLPRTSYDSSTSSGSVLSQRAPYIGRLGPDACFKPVKLLDVGYAALAVLGFEARTKALLQSQISWAGCYPLKLAFVRVIEVGEDGKQCLHKRLNLGGTRFRVHRRLPGNWEGLGADNDSRMTRVWRVPGVDPEARL